MSYFWGVLARNRSTRHECALLGSWSILQSAWVFSRRASTLKESACVPRKSARTSRVSTCTFEKSTQAPGYNAFALCAVDRLTAAVSLRCSFVWPSNNYWLKAKWKHYKSTIGNLQLNQCFRSKNRLETLEAIFSKSTSGTMFAFYTRLPHLWFHWSLTLIHTICNFIGH